MSNVLVGIDEAGRGCWAGPLVAAAVVLKTPIDGLADSKVLSAKKRRELSLQIYANGYIGVGWSDAALIDKVGLTEAVRRAMAQALDQVKISYQRIIVDGNYNFLADRDSSSAIIKADALYPAVSAASIIAKVARDDFMINQDEIYPQYQFAKHKGYGTALHINLLKKYGPSSIHRFSYKPVGAHR